MSSSPYIAKARRLAGVAWSLCLFSILLTVYAASPIRTSADSRWSLHTALSLIQGDRGDLTEFLPALKRHNFYAIEYPDGKPHTLFPIGASVLVAPLVGATALVYPEFVEQLRADVPDEFEKFLASIIGALASVVFFWLTLSHFRNLFISLFGTLIFSLCTSMWSTATRALWQHGPLVLMFLLMMLLIEHARRRPQLIQYSSLPLAMAFVVRPTAAIAVLVVSGYVLLCYRQWFLRYVAWSTLIAVPWIALNFLVYGDIIPHYYQPGRITSSSILDGFLGIMFSPGRGLLVYSPVAIFALSGFIIAMRDAGQRSLNISYGIIVIGITAIAAKWPDWWGGHAFGPRTLTDIVPFFAFYICFNFTIWPNICRWLRVSIFGCMSVLAVISLLMHAQGALQVPPHMWNTVPNNVDENLVRLWDWKDPPFLRF